MLPSSEMTENRFPRCRKRCESRTSPRFWEVRAIGLNFSERQANRVPKSRNTSMLKCSNPFRSRKSKRSLRVETRLVHQTPKHSLTRNRHHQILHLNLPATREHKRSMKKYRPKQTRRQQHPLFLKPTQPTPTRPQKFQRTSRRFQPRQPRLPHHHRREQKLFHNLPSHRE